MEITSEQLKLVAQFNYRMNSMGEMLANNHPEHNTENLSVKWEFDDADNPSKVIINLASSDTYNTSCSCHPEWELRTVESKHEIPLEEITSDVYFYLDTGGIYDDVMYNHPAIERMQAEIKAEKERKEEAARREREEEERQRKSAKERAELEQLARLQAKYPNK